MKKCLASALLALVTLLLHAQDGGKFTTVFNGKDLSGWFMPTNQPPAFTVVDGVIETKDPPNGANLYLQKKYANYIFRFEYLLSEVGNSGVMIRCDAKNAWGTGVEVQLLAPWTPYRDDLHCTGSLYGYVAVTNRPDETTGIWHSMEITCDRRSIKIAVDGKLTTEADIDKYPKLKEKLLKGLIGFQANHGAKGQFARFRNITLRDLDAEPAYVIRGLYESDARFRTQAIEAASAIGASMIPVLTPLLEDEKSTAESAARQALFDIVAQASAPEKPLSDKAAVYRALDAALRNKHSEKATVYLKWLREMIKTTARK